MFANLFALTLSWIGILILIAGAYLVWFGFRVVVDLVRWFNEEVLDDYRERKKRKR